ncbi:Mov34/MPN/PAD-1 family protein [Maridesulfovibrio sp.]|uniref:Mov34/MPN/PAD-1 family protein n=1 Tax=Maridesulfovibrio sp. TaxID=2795000 RepID=UPI003AFFB197
MKVNIYDNLGLKIVVSSDVWDVWSQHIQYNTKDSEACGIIVGGYYPKSKKVILELCTPPKKKDKRKRFGFVLQDRSHQKILNRIHKESDGKSFYLGTWHTHPEKQPSPSQMDLTDWGKCVSRNRHSPVYVFSIIGIESVSIYTYRGINL